MPRHLSKKDEQYLKRCRTRVQAAKKYRDHEGYDELWKRLIDLYRGKHFPEGLSYDDRVAINIAFSTINVIGPSVAVNHPKITVNAQLPEMADSATILEGVVNYWWRHFDLQDEFRLAVNDFLILGFGWLKTGYRFVEEDRNREPDDIDAEVAELIGQADDYAVANPDMAGDLPSDEDIAANVADTELVIVEDRPFVERISPYDVYVDPEATSLRDARWIAHKIEKSLEEVRANDRYDGAARNSVKPDGRMNDEWRPNGCDKDPDYQHVTVWEFYDLIAGTMCVFSEIGDDFLVDPTEQPYAFGHPFVMLRNYDVPEFFYPMGELEAIEDLQQELNLTRTAIINDRKQKRRAWLYDESAFDSKGMSELKSNADNRMIPVVGGRNLKDVVTPLPSQQLDPQMYQNSELILSDMTLISGVNEYMRGMGPDIRRTATEASMIQDAANSRAADKLSKIEKHITSVARRLVQLAQQYMTEEQVARVEGKNGAPFWFAFTPDDIQGEFDFDVVGGSTQPKNESLRRQQAMDMLGALGPMAVPGGPVNVTELLRHVLQHGFDIKDPGRFLAMDPGVAAGLGGPPPTEGPPPDAMPPQGAPPEGAPPEGQPPPDAGFSALPQLEGQVGLSLPSGDGPPL